MGVGQAGPGFVYQTQTCHKFIGSTATQNDLVAWPANGVTLINVIAGVSGLFDVIKQPNKSKTDIDK